MPGIADKFTQSAQARLRAGHDGAILEFVARLCPKICAFDARMGSALEHDCLGLNRFGIPKSAVF
jgi:hypothetical protein